MQGHENHEQVNVTKISMQTNSGFSEAQTDTG